MKASRGGKVEIYPRFLTVTATVSCKSP